MKNNQRPTLRFCKFSEDWEQRKVITFSEETFGGGTPKTSVKEYWDGNIPWIQSSDLKEHNVAEVVVKKKITENGLKNSATKLIPGNSIAIVTRVGVGKIALMQFEYSTSQDFLSLSNLKVDEWFGVYSLYNQLQRELNNVQGTSIKGITKNELLDKEINIPVSLEEQNNIGKYFKQLDEIIILQQQELDALKQTKQGFLQKMFPKEGETVPELRFPEFVEDWKVETLNNVANYRRGSFPQPYGNKEWYDKEHGMPFVQVVDVDKNLKLVDNTKQKISKLAQPKSVYVEAGRVVVTLQGSIGRVAITQYPSYVDRTLLIFENYKFPVDTFYFAYSIQLLFNREKTKAPGGTIKTITKEALSSFPIFLPNIEEQIQIGKFLKQLDDVIALQEQELDALKQTKQAFLQKMFV
ncbi:EcoKI restriction-modification system protein HsdS [Planococcus massiliensis]|uniref:EcoKI restriction-modification system protein HsdS n=1 Tax=Planococcus massiliensis TaxID=1499687 RepID=A0A098EI69_9BACL|nr:restriction endonuclease subunit S [Planococcus massiliensis]CEG21495.1 EcoKI restriction-modification system protein HsdS [Planococcus massiliensis]